MTEHPRRRKTDQWNGRAVVAVEWVWRITTMLLVPLLLWMSSMLVGLDRRVTALEASRFTATDGMEVWRAVEQLPKRDEIGEDIQELRAEIRALREALTDSNR